MSKKVIKMCLSESSIESAIKELKQYQSYLEKKSEELQQRISERLRELMQSGFDNASVDDLVNGGSRNASVKVEIRQSGEITAVVAIGEDAVWVEFGAGVHHNGQAGSSPNPYGSELGYTIGSYGQGRGKQDMWKFKTEGGYAWTYGTPASMPMYNAVKIVQSEIEDMAREVFG